MKIVNSWTKETTGTKQTTKTSSRVVSMPDGLVITVSDINVHRNDGKVIRYRRKYPTKASKRQQKVQESDKAVASRKDAKSEFTILDNGLFDFADLM